MAEVGSALMRRKTIYDLPQEILDRVISYVPDKQSLRACALTHRAWTRASQEHLHAKRRYSWVYGEPQIEPAHYSNPDVAAHVRTLELSSPPPPSEDPDTWEVLARLTRATRLDLTCLDWIYCFEEDRDSLSASFGHITHLSLTDCTWRHGEDFVFFLTAFPHVTELRLEDCAVLPDEDMDLDEFPRQAIDVFPGTALRQLNVELSLPPVELTEFNPLELINAWVSRFPGVVPEGLRFMWASLLGFGILSEYLRALGPVLGELDVKLAGGSSDCDDFGLQTCTRLRHIVVRGLCRPDWHMEDKRAPDDTWAPRILSQVRSPYLETVRLDIEANFLAELHTLDFKQIDSVLCASHARHIKNVTLAIPPHLFLSAFEPRNSASEELTAAGGTEYVTFIVDNMQGLRNLGKLFFAASGFPRSTIRLTSDGDISPPAQATAAPLCINDFVPEW